MLVLVVFVEFEKVEELFDDVLIDFFVFEEVVLFDIDLEFLEFDEEGEEFEEVEFEEFEEDVLVLEEDDLLFDEFVEVGLDEEEVDVVVGVWMLVVFCR